MKYLLCFIAFSMLMGVESVLQAQTFSSFQNGGKLQSAEWDLPSEWSAQKNLKWKFDIAGYGQSSPVIAQGSVYVTSVVGDNKEEVVIECVDLKTGMRKWAYKQPNSSPEKNTVMVSRAAPTPIVDSNGVIAFFEGGNLVALDHSGKLRWKRDFISEYGKLAARHGLAASLEQDDDHVFVWCEREKEPFVVAVSKSDGKNVWKVAGVGATSWGSPRLIQVGSEKHLVLAAMGKIIGLDPASGKRHWEFNDIDGNSSSTPIVAGNGEFLIGAAAGRGAESKPPSCGVLTISQTDGNYQVSWRWKSRKATCSFGSPAIANGKAYFVNRTGILFCHDLKTGELAYNGRLPCGSIWATPLATQSEIYFFGKDGETAVLETGDELKVLRTNKLWEPQKQPEQPGAQPSFSNTVLYAAATDNATLVLRNGSELFAIKE